jgi:phage baseplate assembly protein W
MSKDIQLAHRCPHLTVEERVFLHTDRRSLPTRQPVGADSSVRILANNDIVIPRYGLFSQAQLFGSLSGPFRILRNEETLTIQTGTAQVNVVLPVGSRVETNAVVSAIALVSTVVVAENSNGHLVLTEIDKLGSESWISVSGLAAESLGFTLQTRSRGSQVYPGWNLAVRPDKTISNRFPRFNTPVQQNPVFKVTYSVPQRRCLRCGGSQVENDYRFDGQGSVLVVENENLLHQVALKILLTGKGTNLFHPWYGTSLKSRIGSKAIGTVAALINEDVRRALENMQRLQVAQSKFQQVSYKERLASIQSVRTYPLDMDPSTFMVEVVVVNASREAVNVSTVFTVPNVITLDGDGFGQRG